MQRHNSKNSITSNGSLSRSGEKKPSPTHMIVQRENDNKIILLPTTHLVNSSVARVRLNDTATFKVVLNNRKQERGRILQLGNKEECTEQLQIFEMTADIEAYEKTTDSDDNHNNEDEYAKEKQRKVQESLKKSTTTSFNDRIRTNNGLNQNFSHSSNKNQTDYVNKKKENLKSKHSQIEEEVEDEENNENEEDSYSITSKGYFDDNMLSNRNVEKRAAAFTGKHSTNSFSKKLLNKEINHKQVVSQSQITIGASSNDMNKYDDNGATTYRSIGIDRNELSELNFDENDLMYSYEELWKKYEAEREKNFVLEKQNRRLLDHIGYLKKTTIPVPKPEIRRWLIDTGKSLDTKDPNANIQTTADALKITNVRDLIDCVDKSTTNTARQVVKLLYPLSVRETEPGEHVTVEVRKIIRAFAESHFGPVTDYAFNEAINGLFRSAKLEAKRAQEGENQATSKNNLNKSNRSKNKGQKTLTQIMKSKNKSSLYSNDTHLDKEDKRDKEDREEYED